MKTFFSATLAVGALALCPALSLADSAPFGIASAYNLFALGGTNVEGAAVAGNISTQADVTGRAAASGAILNGTTFGSSLNADPYGALAPFALVSTNGFPNGGQFNLNTNGNVYAPGTAGNINFNGGGHRVTTGGSSINFASMSSTFDTETNYLASLTPNGVVGATVPGANPSWLVLQGTSATLNVFNITAAQFASNNNNIDIVAPLGSTVIVNVAGSNVTLGAALYYNGVQHAGGDSTDNHILFNFAGADSVAIDGQFDASVLAPYATLSGNAQMDGNFIAAAVGQTGEVHNVEFVGALPTDPGSGTAPNSPVPEPATLSLLGTGIISAAGMMRRLRRS